MTRAKVLFVEMPGEVGRPAGAGNDSSGPHPEPPRPQRRPGSAVEKCLEDLRERGVLLTLEGGLTHLVQGVAGVLEESKDRFLYRQYHRPESSHSPCFRKHLLQTPIPFWRCLSFFC